MWLLQLLLLFVASIVAVYCGDPEINMTTPQRIQYWGYPVEIHKATTSDGFILTMHRIPRGKIVGLSGNAIRPIVFMQHGLLGSSSQWIDNLPNQSAGYVFADAGFDVWLGNVRGNVYSDSHIRYSMNQNEFWDWSWDEMAKHDLQTMIEYAMAIGRQQQVYYIGHSQGTLTMFAKLSTDPNFSRKIRKFFALAPIGRAKNMKGVFAGFAHSFNVASDFWFQVFGSHSFLSEYMKSIINANCNSQVFDWCDDFIARVGGPPNKHWNTSRVPVYAAHNPAGTSSKNMLHWVQMINKGSLSRFDYGAEGNRQHYGSISPPAYDFSHIQNQIYLYWGGNDFIANSTDVKEYLLKVLPATSIKANVQLPEYNHYDFIWGLKAVDDIYKPIIQTINNDLVGR